VLVVKRGEGRFHKYSLVMLLICHKDRKQPVTVWGVGREGKSPNFT